MRRVIVAISAVALAAAATANAAGQADDAAPVRSAVTSPRVAQDRYVDGFIRS